MSVYACADLHGRGDLWDKIKNFLKPEDTLYFLGDAADRGPDGWRIIKEMLADPRIVYIKGNHEDLLVKAIYSLKELDGNTFTRAFLIWELNGGKVTYNSILKDKETNIIDIIEQLDKLPLAKEYYSKNYKFFLSHAGCTDPEDASDLLWDRSHFYDIAFITPLPGLIIVHGHTPANYLKRELEYYEQVNGIKQYQTEHNGAFWYAWGTKIDLDCASAKSGYTVLLNLDTLDFIPITTF